MNTRMDRILQCLEMAFHPLLCELIDESAKHTGHVGAQSGKGHFLLRIKSPGLASLPRVQAHQKIYQALGELMQTEIHALSIHIL